MYSHSLDDLDTGVGITAATYETEIWQVLTIDKRVKKIVADHLGINETLVRNKASFTEDLGADSLDTVELVLALEDEFKIDILDESPEKILSVQDAIDFISSRITLYAAGFA